MSLPLLVVTTTENFKAFWQVLDPNNKCKVLATNLNTPEDGHNWIAKHSHVKEVK